MTSRSAFRCTDFRVRVTTVPLSSVHPGGKTKPEMAASLRTLIDPDGAPTRLREPSHGRKAETEPWNVRFPTNVRFEHLLAELSRDPWASVAHGDLDIRPELANADSDSSQCCISHVLHRVGEEVCRHADEDARAARHGERRIRRLIVDLDMLRFGFELHVLDDAAKGVGHTCFRFTQGSRKEVSTGRGEYQEPIDEFGNAVHRAAGPSEQLARPR